LTLVLACPTYKRRQKANKTANYETERKLIGLKRRQETQLKLSDLEQSKNKIVRFHSAVDKFPLTCAKGRDEAYAEVLN
jgi:hypothetical protein